MKYRPLGKSGIQASVVGFGAWAIGGWMWGGTKKNDPKGAIRAAIDHGINLIDTAPMYGFGQSEQLVGEALRGLRDKEDQEKYEAYINLRPAMIRHEIEESL